MADTLRGPGPFTVFAPTNDAFAKLRPGTLQTPLSDVPALRNVLLYHVVPGNVTAADVVKLTSATTAQVLENVRQAILTEKNLREVVRLTNEELAKSLSQLRERLGTIERQTNEVDTRLRKLYEALETGALELGELAPRIRELRAQRELLDRAKGEVAEALDESKVTLVDREEVLSYLDQFHELLQGSSIAERRRLLRSFVESLRSRAGQRRFTTPCRLN